ncbi:MAG TPA: imidazole glycerol phosphate synthase subunit HisH [Jatrophihabitans sp.]|uniref:imidazole glycerol phosphate synthase subunit HisH n=1 Tax=Jatrophihabitans sp. TaxID=1932789 RepID=UPI002EF370A7
MLDYGSGNIRSAVRALERVGAEVRLSADPHEAIEADGLVVPGVGAFAACMAGLRAVGAERILAERIEAGRPVLGICVGMQVLFDAGIEHGVQTPGLGLLPGRVEQLNAPVIPHMGWNTVRPPAGSVLFDGVGEDTRFYFVHSYAVHPSSEHPSSEHARSERPSSERPSAEHASARHASDGRAGYAATLAEHGEDFVAAVEAGPLSATQFHPEKSGDAGAQLLANWLGTL